MKKLFVLIATVILMQAVLVSCQTKAGTQPRHSATPVTVARIEARLLQRPIHATGIVAAPDEATLSFKTGGPLARIYVKEGQRVKKGTVLARLEEDELRAYAEQARAALEKAERDVRRVEALFADSAATLQQKQDSHTALLAARARYEAVQFNYKKAVLIAPYDGLILRRWKENGELVGPGVPVLTLGHTDVPSLIRVNLSDKDILRCQIGDSAHVTSDAFAGRVFRARVSRLAGSALPGSGLYGMELTLEDTNSRMLPGFVTRVTLYPSQKQKLALVPASAMTRLTDKQGTLFVMDENTKTVKKIDVTPAFITDHGVAVYPPAPVFTVVVRGAAYLSDGQTVQINEPLSNL